MTAPTTPTAPSPPPSPSSPPSPSPDVGRRAGVYILDDFKDMMAGRVVPPNLEEIDPAILLNAMACSGWNPEPGVQTMKRAMDANGWGGWARYFLDRGQGNQLYGSGMILLYGTKIEDGLSVSKPRAFRFALCKHKPVEGLGANHSRGWHPAHCSLCGLDLSVDSGD